MPRIPSLTPKEVLKKFKKLGYLLDRQKGSHLILYHQALRKRIVIPLHLKDLPKGTLLAIIKEAGLTKTEFLKI